MIPRGGEASMGMLAKVPHGTLEPLINALMAPGPGVSTDAYDLYRRVERGG